jgi:hypothetical protein
MKKEKDFHIHLTDPVSIQKTGGHQGTLPNKLFLTISTHLHSIVQLVPLVVNYSFHFLQFRSCRVLQQGKLEIPTEQF